MVVALACSLAMRVRARPRSRRRRRDGRTRAATGRRVIPARACRASTKCENHTPIGGGGGGRQSATWPSRVSSVVRQVSFVLSFLFSVLIVRFFSFLFFYRLRRRRETSHVVVCVFSVFSFFSIAFFDLFRRQIYDFIRARHPGSRVHSVVGRTAAMCIVIHPILRALYALFTGGIPSFSSAVEVTVSPPRVRDVLSVASILLVDKYAPSDSHMAESENVLKSLYRDERVRVLPSESIPPPVLLTECSSSVRGGAHTSVNPASTVRFPPAPAEGTARRVVFQRDVGKQYEISSRPPRTTMHCSLHALTVNA